MSETVMTHIIARIRTDFPTKFGIPRQSGLADVPARIVFEPEYRNADALRGIEEYSHLWLIWQFSEAVRESWSPTVRPPKLGGNRRVGVFATRSPFRPKRPRPVLGPHASASNTARTRARCCIFRART